MPSRDLMTRGALARTLRRNTPVVVTWLADPITARGCIPAGCSWTSSSQLR
jgi:hypothetical protein